MANYRAIKDGNWSDLTVWEDNGGSGTVFSASTVLPGIDDICYANSFNVYIDMDISVDTLRNHLTTNVAVSLGCFIINDNQDRSIVIGTQLYGTSTSGVNPVLDITANNITNTITIVCPRTTASTGSSHGIIMVNGPCTINYIGTINSSSYSTSGMYITCGGVTINHTGAILPNGTDGRAYGVRCVVDVNPEIPIIYNLTGNMGAPGLGVGTTFTSNAAFQLNVVGNLYRNSGNNVIYNSGSYQYDIDIRGNLFSITGAVMINLTGSNPLSSLTIREGLYSIAENETTSLITVTNVNVPVNLHNMNIESNDGAGYSISAQRIYITHDKPTYCRFEKDGEYYYMYSHPTGQPIEKDVRDGITYGGHNEMEGTLKVPPKEAVGIGVLTDDTVGEADYNLANIKASLEVINDGVKKATLFVPHNEDLPND